jgi:cytoskeletal protein CcmA (bactofilin family)
MLSSFKSKAPEKDKQATTNVAEVTADTVQPQHSVVESGATRPEPATKAETHSCIGSGMSIVGNVECNGPARVFGRIEGELRASDLLIGDGAQIEGNVIAQDVTVCGRVNGTIRALRVKLRDGGAVEGDIFHRSLSIDESSLFEGSSRRVENPTDPSSRAPVQRTSAKKARPTASTAAKPTPATPPAQPAAATGTPGPPRQPAPPEERIGVVTHYYSHLSVATLRLVPSTTLRVGDMIHIRGHTTDFSQRVGSLEVNHAAATEVGPKDDFGLKVIEHAREHDVVYKVRP